MLAVEMKGIDCEPDVVEESVLLCVCVAPKTTIRVKGDLVGDPGYATVRVLNELL